MKVCRRRDMCISLSLIILFKFCLISKGMLSGDIFVCVCVCVCFFFGGGGWMYRLPPPSPTFLKFVSILTKYAGKTFWPNVVGKFGVFYRKKLNFEMRNFINILSRRNQTFTGDDGFYRSYISYVPTIMLIMNI